MLSKIQTYVSNTGVKDAQAQVTNEKVNEIDRIHLLDGKGNQITLDSGVIFRSLVVLAGAREMTPDQYITEFRKVLEEGNEDAKKSE